MLTDRDLQGRLQSLDGRGYKAYKTIEGRYRFGRFTLVIDHVQGDPYAAPSRMRVQVARGLSGFAADTTGSPSRDVALCDYLTRTFDQSCRRFSRGSRGIGKSGLITIDAPGQEILARNSMRVDAEQVEARFFMGLPAFGRRIAARDAMAMCCEELPRIVDAALFMAALDRGHLYRHIETAEDADALRALLAEKELVAFVADGARLPRRSGIDPRPLEGDQVVASQAPETLRITLRLPNCGEVTGMAIGRGITLIVGGGYHGKSTLLNALELGVYNHLPGDGRERVVTVPAAVKIRAADGRSIQKADISPFINNLPFGQDTTVFSTANASGSTSQAAGICEALEAGADVLLLDEDTSATNFMIRDHRMQRLVHKEQEPITPFIDKVRQLYSEKGVSTVLVMGGSGDYFSVADRVIQMRDYRPLDVTRRAHQIADEIATGRNAEGGAAFGSLQNRIPLAHSINPARGRRTVKITAQGRHTIRFGREEIDLGDLEQIVAESQTRAIGFAIYFATRFMDGRRSLREVIDRVCVELASGGLDLLTPYPTGDLAGFRPLELAAAINRMRPLQVATRPRPAG